MKNIKMEIHPFLSWRTILKFMGEIESYGWVSAQDFQKYFMCE